MKSILGALTGFACALMSSIASAQTTPFSDSLVQPPELAAPSRGSIAGQYASVAFGPGDVSRGAYSLPLPLTLPTERGTIGASFTPSYSPDAAISEWGAGWAASNLMIYRSRPSGDLDYTTDERTGPWGRMVQGVDGAWYPVGLGTLVRVEEKVILPPNPCGPRPIPFPIEDDAAPTGPVRSFSAFRPPIIICPEATTSSTPSSQLIAHLPDGSTWTFDSGLGIAGVQGTYAWQLQSVVTMVGRKTSYAYSKNASGRPFLTSVTWGGTDPGNPQYQTTFDYETLALPIADYRAGRAVLLDQRIKGVHALVHSGGGFVERDRYDLTFTQDGGSPTFYLASLQETFAGGAQAPAVKYTYSLSRDYFAQASGQRVPKLDSIFQQYGADVFLPTRSTAFDADLDGRPDLEFQFDDRVLRQTDTGFVVDTLPALTSSANPLCRRAPNQFNTPRLLARMRAGVDDSNVVALVDDANHANTGMAICDRSGETQWQTTFKGEWVLGPNTRLVDLTRDHQPDLIRVYSGGYEAMANTSTATSFGFAPSVSGTLSPAIQADTSWIHDVNGDGIADLVSRYPSGVIAWMGEGNLQFDPQGKAFPILSATGQTISNLKSFQFVFFDANNDGITDLLLSNGTAMMLFANNGNAFVSVSVPSFQNTSWASIHPAVLDVAGNGNTEIAFVQNNLAYAIDLDAPGVGLLTKADDGRGSVVQFGYQRALPEVGVRSRNSLLAQVQVMSTGYDALTYEYNYTKPDLHSIGRFLLGYEGVTRQGDIDSATMTFSNTDDAPGMMLTSIEHDNLVPNVEKVEFRSYEAATVRGVPWQRRKSDGKGWRSTDPLNPRVHLATTDYLAYDREVCPSSIQATTSAGVLSTTKTFASLPAFASTLSCLQTHATMLGSHADTTLDFRHELDLTLNDAGQLTEATALDRNGKPTILQQIAYTPAGQISAVTTPGKGTQAYAYDAATGLITSLTAADGIVTSADTRNPSTDSIQALTVNRGGASYHQEFRFDGQERLAKTWNNLGQASETSPNVTVAYRYADSTKPGLIQTTTLIDLARGASLRTTEVQTAAGEGLAKSRLIPEGWAFDSVTQKSRASRKTTSLMKAAVPDVTALDVPSLYASAQITGVSQKSLFGFDVASATKLHADVEQDIASTLALNGDIDRTSVENGSFTTITSTDEQQHVTRHRDAAGADTTYGYDALGRVRRALLADGAKHQVDYDDYGRVARVDRGGVGAITYAYSPTTNLMTERAFLAAAGTATAGSIVRRVDYTYDAIGRVLTETNTDGVTGASSGFQYYWDGATPANPAPGAMLGYASAVQGDRYLRTTIYRPDGTEARTVVSIANWRSIQTDTRYAEDGSVRERTLTVTDGAGNVVARDDDVTQRDTYGRTIASLRDGSAFATYAYDVNGQPLWINFGGPLTHGEVATLTHDPLTRHVVGINQNNAAWASAVSVRMNNRGFVDSEDISVGSLARHRAFGYTPQGFLAHSTDSDSTYDYTYDAAGAPSGIASTVSGITDTRTFAREGNVLTAGAHHHKFDDAGRVIERDDVTLTYGPDGEVATAHRGGSSWSYLYDEAGNRVAKLVAGVPVAAFLPNGTYVDPTSLTIPIRFSGQTIGVVRASAIAGSTTKAFSLVAVDLTGSVLADTTGVSRLGSPFGDRATHPDVAAAIDFATKGWDADLGVVRMGVRDYDPSLSRFLTPDPLFFEHLEKCVESPVDCGLYAYARNNPLVFLDPSGMEPSFFEKMFIGVVEMIGCALGCSEAAAPENANYRPPHHVSYGAQAIHVAALIAPVPKGLSAFTKVMMGEARVGILAVAGASRGARLVAIDTDAIVKFYQPEVQAALRRGDVLVATPNVVVELETRVGIKNVDAFLANRGIRQLESVPGAAVPATKLRQTMDAVVGAGPAGRGNAGDALNLGEAGASGADLFLTADKNTIGKTFGMSGSIELPNTGGATLQIQVVTPPAAAP